MGSRQKNQNRRCCVPISKQMWKVTFRTTDCLVQTRATYATLWLPNQSPYKNLNRCRKTREKSENISRLVEVALAVVLLTKQAFRSNLQDA